MMSEIVHFELVKGTLHIMTVMVKVVVQPSDHDFESFENLWRYMPIKIKEIRNSFIVKIDLLPMFSSILMFSRV